jgi:excisionase family DNA binding protein
MSITVREASDRLGDSTATVYSLCAGRRLGHIRVGVGKGTIRIREQDLDAYLAKAIVAPEGMKRQPVSIQQSKIGKRRDRKP